jgi:hypothetical protein
MNWKATYGRVAARVVKGVARLNSAPERGLTESERALVEPIFRTSLELSKVRIREGVSGLLNVSRRAFAIEQTVYFPRGYVVAPHVLVHELCHVWQFQNGGHAYIADAVHAQTLGDGYDIEKGLLEGREWAALNAEQQATLVEEAFFQGCIADETKRFVLSGRDWTDSWRVAAAELRAGRGATFSLSLR